MGQEKRRQKRIEQEAAQQAKLAPRDALERQYFSLENRRDEALKILLGCVADPEIDSALSNFTKLERERYSLAVEMNQIGFRMKESFDPYSRLSPYVARRYRCLKHDRPEMFKLDDKLPWRPLVETIKASVNP